MTMKGKMFFVTIHILCIVQFSSLKLIADVTEHSSEEGEEPRAGFVRNGILPSTWSHNLPAATEDIDLSNLGLKKLHELEFSKFHALNELNLSVNKLTSTENIAAAFRIIAPLILNLSHNNFGPSSQTFVLGSKYFWSIDLSNNYLVTLVVDFDVTYLNLSNNQIQCHDTIASGRDHGKPIHVGALDLSHNLINCQQHLFTNNIDILDMSYNKLTGLGIELLEYLKDLTKLNLSHNNIRYIHPRAFEHTLRLRQLDLQFNRIRVIDPHVWFSTPSLEYIDLSSNQLGHLNWDTVTFSEKPSSLIDVNIQNNSNVNWRFDGRVVEYFKFCTIEQLRCSRMDT